MNAKALRILEYDKVLSMLEAKATSDPGRALCRGLSPMTDLEGIEAAQQNTADALARIFRQGSINFGSNRSLGMSLRSLEIGSTLSMEELLHIAALLENTARVRQYGRSEKEETPPDSLTAEFDSLDPLPSLSAEIRRCILSEDEIADDASANLKRIRRSMTLTGERIHSQLTGLVNGPARTYLQDAVITTREGRYCIPVKAEYKGLVPGMIHDQSSTGSTFFIEPAAVVTLNNQLRELEIEEQKEIAVILANLSARAGECAIQIAEDQKILTRLDFIFAKASLALDMNATRPVFNREHYIRLRQGRHPLLEKKKVVPIDVSLGETFDLLIVTGPNTGGKTVSLKTVGLLSLMGQAGLHIPAQDRSALSVFTEIFADIGDEQSIEQSLSTFSSHMTSIVSILQHADENSLCLFDELGAGTDPTEGAALAIAILNFLHDRGIRTMATTHYSELKLYALSTDFVENACCEFDVETLRPTYRLLIGIPGKSNAFAISRKLGLSEEIIEAAKAQIDEQDVSFEDVLSGLEQRRIAMEQQQRQIDADRAEAERLRKQLQEKSDRLEQSRDRILREANEKARDILREAKETADDTIRIFQKAGPNASIRDLEKAREQLRGKIGEKDAHLSVREKERTAPAPKPDQLKKGDLVQIPSMGLKGTVSTLPDARGNLFVQCGILRTSVNVSDLVRVEEKTITAPNLQRSGTGKLRMAKSFSVSPEINLLGKTVDEALSELDKYLDDAYLAHLKSVRIVHGKGTGALRQAVQKHLKKVKYVKSYRLGEYGEGDAGVTIAEFKE